jgi:hypothetical protein
VYVRCGFVVRDGKMRVCDCDFYIIFAQRTTKPNGALISNINTNNMVIRFNVFFLLIIFVLVGFL